MYLDKVMVVFDCADTKHFFSRWIHPLINHCYLMKPDNGRWLVYAKTLDSVQIYTTDNLKSIIATSYIIKSQAVIQPRGLFMLSTCVGQVKQALGIRKPFILTPYQLFKYLKRCDDEKAKEA